MFDLDEGARVEMSGSTDRGCAILGGSYIDAKLTKALQQHLVRDYEVQKKLFRPGGALGAFETKIRLAYLTGLIGPEFHHDLLIIKAVRNKFAHEEDWRGFDEDRPELRAIEKFKYLTVGIDLVRMVKRVESSRREKFENAVAEGSGLLAGRRLPAMPEPSSK